MNAPRRIVLGAVAMLSLLGTVGAVEAATPTTTESSVTATRWCC